MIHFLFIILIIFCNIIAGSPKDALAMLCRAGLFETAQRLENEHFGSKGAPEVYIA